MEKEVLTTWIAKRGRRIKKRAADVSPSFMPETIHEFRTETKKLRAMLHLIGMDAADPPELPKAFHKVYSAAGKLRDLQMQVKYIATDKRHSLPAFAIWLANKTGDAAQEWNHKYNRSALREVQDELSRLSGSHPDRRQLLRYFIFCLEKIKAVAEDNPDDDALHEARKQVKDMGYLLAFCKKHWPEVWPLVEPLEQGVARLADKAGSYNDLRNLLLGMERFSLEYGEELEDDEMQAIVVATEDWRAAKGNERRALIKAMLQLTTGKQKPVAPFPFSPLPPWFAPD